jgi:hypothetical protein
MSMAIELVWRKEMKRQIANLCFVAHAFVLRDIARAG